nr:hypothetical protein [Tanacetum cinerariifolium]
SSSRLTRDQTSNPTSSTNTTPKGRNRRSSKQKVENSNLEEHLPPVVTMADNLTMAELLRAPTEGYAEAIVVPPILVDQFELKHNLINMMTTDQFFGLEKDNPHDHIRGNLLERSTQDVLTIIENKSKVRNSRSKSLISQVKACDVNFNSEIAKLTHAVNQQMSVVTTAMTAMLKQFQATPPPAPVKAVEEICITCGGAHPYYQCLAADGNTFPEFKDNIQGYVSAAVVNYNQGNPGYRPQGVANQTQIDMVKTELRTKMKSSIQTSLSNQINEIKNIMASLLQMNTASTSGSGSLPSNTIANPKGELKAITTRSGLVTNRPTVPTPPKSITPEVDERLEETYTDPDLAEYTIKVPPPPVQKYKPPSQREFVVHKRDPLHPTIPYPSRMLKKNSKRKMNELKCKALADLGASINLMPLSVWKELGLPELIPTRMTLELANRAICTPAGIARDVFTARALIDLHGEEMILRDGDERLTLNMKHDTSSYSNQPQRESVNLINFFNVSSEYFLEPSGNPTFSSHPELTSSEVQNDIFDSEGGNVLPEKLLDLDSTKDFHPHLHDNPLSGSTTYSSSPNPLLEELADELALITFPPKYDDDLQFDVEFDLKEIEFLCPRYESDTENVYDDPFDSKGEKIKESKLLIDELDLPCDFFFPSEYDSFISQDFSMIDAKPSTNNEDKVFNQGILIQEKPFEIITRVVQDKMLATSNASLVLEDFDPPFYEPLFFKEVPRSNMLLPFSSENKEKVFKLGIHTSEKVHSSRIP